MLFNFFNRKRDTALNIYKQIRDFKQASVSLPKEYRRGQRTVERYPITFEVSSSDCTRGVVLEVGKTLQYYLMWNCKRYGTDFETALKAIADLTSNSHFVQYLPKAERILAQKEFPIESLPSVVVFQEQVH